MTKKRESAKIKCLCYNIIMEEKPYQKGFTLIELALSLVFVSLLMLAVALITRDTIVSYRRGLTLNQINTVGMDVVDDIRAAVQNAQSKSLLNDCMKYYYNNTDSNAALEACKADQGYNFVYWVKKAEVRVGGELIGSDVPIYGAFCTGTYSYIWNSGYFETEGVRINGRTDVENMWATLRYLDASRTPQMVAASSRNATKPFRLLKVRDDQRGVCAGVIRNRGGSPTNPFTTIYEPHNGDLDEIMDFDGVFDMTDYLPVDDRELPVDIVMTDKTYDLAIYDLFAARPAISSTQKNMFYSASFILGTIDGGINVLEHGKSCAVPTEYTMENYDYCSINKFTFAAQSGTE